MSAHAVAACVDKGLPAVVKKLEDETGSYDLVSNDGMLEHFLNFAPYARHLMRISRRYVLLLQPNHQSFAGGTLNWLANLLRRDKLVYEYNYRIADFVELFGDNGFRLIENRPLLMDVARLLLFEKRPLPINR